MNKKQPEKESCFSDAIMVNISSEKYALLQWDFIDRGYARYSVKMPIEAIKKILEWSNENA